MKRDVILIGPVGVGKSTVARLISERLNIPQASLDEKRWEIYEENGYDFEYAERLYTEEGFLGMYQYWKPYEAYSVKRVLELFPNCIHDFGAGQSVYEDEKLFEAVRDILEPYPNVILLLPSIDAEESKKILSERTDFEFNHLFIETNCNKKLAKLTVYTNGKTPEETCEEIIKIIKV